MKPDETMKSVVHSRYGCFWLRGESRYAIRNDVLETPARVRRWSSELALRFAKAFEALVAEGRVNSVGSVRVVKEYERPCGYDC